MGVAAIYNETFMDVRRIIADSYLAAGFTEEFTDKLASISTRMQFKSGEYMMRDDDDSRDLMILAEGRAEVRTQAEDVIGYLKSPMPFGEVAFLDGKRRSGSVVAVADCTVVQIPEQALRDLLRAEPAMAVRALMNLSQILCDRLRKANQQIAALNAIEEATL
jgi:CRP-like cAMP-binding protein